MNESEEISSPAPENLAEQIEILQRRVFILLLALIVVSGTLATYLWYQARLVGFDLATIKPQAQQMIQTFNQNRPGIEKFVSQLAAYGNTHPDFAQQVLKKYGFPSGTQPAAAAPGATAAPKK